MAIDFSKAEDWGVSPEEAVKSQREALANTEDISAAEQNAQKSRRGQLILDTYRQVGQAASAGDQPKIGGLVGAAQQKAAELLPQQGMEADTTASRAAGLKEEIIGTKQSQAVSNYNRATEELKQKTADYISKRAFDMGYDARQLAYHQSGYVADRALQQTKDDFDAGRATKAELQQMEKAFTLESKRLQNELQQMSAKLQGQLELDLANKDKAAAKARLDKYIDKMKEMAQAQAKANAYGAMLGGAATIGGAVVGTALGGPAGGMAGATAGGYIGQGVGSTLGG